MRDDLDRILDAGLGTYVSAEPQVALEQRVMARCVRRRRVSPWWWVAVPAMAAAALFLLMVRPEAPKVEVLRPVARVEAPAAEVVQEPIAPVRAKARKRLRRPQVFPTPSPLTEEERALLRLAAARPDVLERPVAEFMPIEPIQIAPLGSSDLMEEE